MNDLIALCDRHGLTVSFSRLANPEEPRYRWYVSVYELMRESTLIPDGETVCGLGETQELAAQELMQRIRANKCFRVVRESTEKRVELEVANV